MRRRKFLQAFGLGTITTLSGCSEVLGGRVESEELECDSTDTLRIEKGDTEAYSENSWVQGLNEDVTNRDILVSYDGEEATVQYDSYGGVIDDTEERRGGLVQVGEHKGEEVYRFFRRKDITDDYIEIETGLDRDGFGDTDFGNYEEICAPVMQS